MFSAVSYARLPARRWFVSISTRIESYVSISSLLLMVAFSSWSVVITIFVSTQWLSCLMWSKIGLASESPRKRILFFSCGVGVVVVQDCVYCFFFVGLERGLQDLAPRGIRGGVPDGAPWKQIGPQ